MPTYDYKCSNCGYAYELFQSMKDDPVTECPQCREQTLKRLIGAGAGLVFKGSGFYLTDYGKGNGGSGNGKSASSPASSSSSSNGSSSPASTTPDSSSGGASAAGGASSAPDQTAAPSNSTKTD